MRKKIAVLFGGCSPEYEVSLQSAFSVITHMNPDKYEAILLGITREGAWYLFSGDTTKIRDDAWHNEADCVPAFMSPCRNTKGVWVQSEARAIPLDAAMPMLHGKNGEDGSVQGLLELAGIPVVGCKTMCSALCMDKDRAHKIAASARVRVPQAFTVTRSYSDASVLEQAQALGYPVFVKPVKAGSSFGITRVAEQDGLTDAIESAFRYDDAVIVEESITGFEVGCAIMGSDELTVGVVDEIELHGDMFDFKEKYTLETTSIHVPARVSGQKAEEIKTTAKTIYRALGCSGFARVDMFLTPNGDIVFNEVNTIPGFTSHSRFPGMLGAAGMTLYDIVNTAIDEAVGA